MCDRLVWCRSNSVQSSAIRYEVEPVDAAARIVVQSSLVANEPVPEHHDDPRAASALRAPLVGEYHSHGDLEVALGHQTRVSGLRIVAGPRPRGRGTRRHPDPGGERGGPGPGDRQHSTCRSVSR